MTGSIINYERLKQRRLEGSSGGSGWKPKEGENRLRILPPHSRYLTAWDTMEDIAVYFEIHYFRIAGRQQIEVSRCPKDLKQPCPACDAFWVHRNSADPGLKELAKQIKSGRVYLMNVLDINNMAAGIQHWNGNNTCWNAILEIVANPAWGNVLDPANGVNFFITLVPGNRSKTGFPQYSVQPEPQRTTVMEILNGRPGWQARLDQLEEQVTPMKTAAEIQALLDAMRIPPPAGQPSHVSVARSIAPPAGVSAVMPAPASVPQPVAPTVPAAVVQPVVVPVPIAPASGSVHYDPGPQYQPKTPDGQRPAGVPRCFGDYNPAVHQCNPCPVKGPCQIKMLGIA